ncbi:Cyanovirin-N [Naviculisporaceae sp. PSN 640]
MARFQDLPFDILVELTSSTQSIRDLGSLILASRPCYTAFSAHRTLILDRVLQSELGPGNYRELRAIYHIPTGMLLVVENGHFRIRSLPRIPHGLTDSREQLKRIRPYIVQVDQVFAILASALFGRDVVLAAPSKSEVNARAFSPAEERSSLYQENSGPAITKRSYGASCSDCVVGYPSKAYMTCVCKKTNGDIATTPLNLNGCLLNQGGNLRWLKNGNFADSCDSLGLVGTVLNARCANGNGGYTRTNINLG